MLSSAAKYMLEQLMPPLALAWRLPLVMETCSAGSHTGHWDAGNFRPEPAQTKVRDLT